MNLVPETPTTTPHHWCTWNRQNAAGALAAADPTELLDSRGAQAARNSIIRGALSEWLAEVHPLARRDLLVVLDDGWDVPLPPAETKPWFGSMAPHPDRFPGSGDAEESLRGIVELARNQGWRGAGVWVCVQEPPRVFPGGAFPAEREAYWAACARRFAAAGATYWKCDWGASSRDEEYRRMLSRIARREAPDLWVEHTVCRWPLNDWQNNQRLGEDLFLTGRHTLGYSDVFRTYDVLTPLSFPTTLERVALHLADSAIEPQARGLVHCEDEAYLGAVLGCVLGVMRYPLPSELRGRPNPAFPPRFEAGRAILGAQDEVARAVRWSRIAPAWRPGGETVLLDPGTLQDTWEFREFETTFSAVVGQTIGQRAPARVSRGLPLPEVTGEGEPPYVLAARHPSGACAIGTFGRVDAVGGWRVPRAGVTVDLGEGADQIGVFGHYGSLTLRIRGAGKGTRVWAQDLLGTDAEEITLAVRLSEGVIGLPGDLVDRVGLACSTPGDRSEPGLVLHCQPARGG